MYLCIIFFTINDFKPDEDVRENRFRPDKYNLQSRTGSITRVVIRRSLDRRETGVSGGVISRKVVEGIVSSDSDRYSNTR